MQWRIDKSIDKLSDRPIDKSVDKSVNKPVDKPIDKPIDNAAALNLAHHHCDRAREERPPEGAGRGPARAASAARQGGRSLPRLPSRSRVPLGRLGTRSAARGATYAPRNP